MTWKSARRLFGNAERFPCLERLQSVKPFKNGLPDEAHWQEHMRRHRPCCSVVIIYMLRGWELSKGAKLELDGPARAASKRCSKTSLIFELWKKTKGAGREFDRKTLSRSDTEKEKKRNGGRGVECYVMNRWLSRLTRSTKAIDTMRKLLW